ncbi:MAG: nitrogen regulation protein [Pseudomonadota bacterium]|jgi:two-component system nitrogen regulation response regulator GlnG
MSAKRQSISDFLSNHLKEYFAIHEGDSPNSGLYDLVVKEVEKVTIAETLKYTHNIQAQAASILGISRNTLRKKMEDFDMVG